MKRQMMTRARKNTFLLALILFPVSIASANSLNLKIISPVEDAVYARGATVLIKSNADNSNPNIKVVQFFRDDFKYLFGDGKAPYEFKVRNLTLGQHILRTRVIYKNGMRKDSSVNITIGSSKNLPSITKPVVKNNPVTTNNKEVVEELKVISPLEGAVYARGASILIKSNEDDSNSNIRVVQFFRDNYKYLFGDGKAPYEFKVRNLTPGNHILRTRVYYKNGSRKDAMVNIRVGEVVQKNPVIVPKVEKYTIGGNVNGLARGNSVVLKNKNGNKLTVNTNTGFNFSTALNNGSHYSVSIDSQSVIQNQTCLVNHAKGKVAGKSISNIKVSCTDIVKPKPLPIVVTPSQRQDYQVDFVPPVMNNPEVIDLSEVTPIKWPAYGLICSGLIINVSLNKDEDYIITMTGNTPLKYPVRVEGGRNVRVVGLDIRPIVQPGCDVGQLPVNLRPSGQKQNANYHPRMPLGMAMQLIQTHTSFVEGVFVDLNGIEADCFVARNFGGLPNSVARKQRDIVIQNTACWGGESQQYTAAHGDGLHGDFFQNQGEVMRNFVIENSTQHSSSHSLIQHSWGGYHAAVNNIIKRYDYSEDQRYANDDVGDIGGMGYIMDGNAENWLIEDVYGEGQSVIQTMIVKRPPNAPLEQFSYTKINGSINKNPNIHKGKPANGHFAKKDKIGLNYVSPHD